MHLSKVFCFQVSVTLVQGNKDLSITDLTSDSRQAKRGCLFAAISGKKIDGHSFIENAIRNGAVAILTDRRDIKFPKNITVLFSDNVRGDFAKACAIFWPSRPSFSVAVTGTNGKHQL